MINIKEGLDVLDDAIALAKLLLDSVRNVPPAIGISLVTYPKDKDLNHLRIVNVGSTTVHGFTLYIGESDGSASEKVRTLRRRTVDEYGSNVLYEITVPDEGIYLRPNSPVFVPTKDLPGKCDATTLYASFEYVDLAGKTVRAPLRHVVSVKAT